LEPQSGKNNMQNILTVIPARGGSKGVEYKNMRNVAGKPLLWYSISAAKDAEYLNDIVVTTDDKFISQYAKDNGVLSPFIRPKELSTDSAQSAPVVEHAVRFMEERNDCEYDAVLMLQPTSPLRTSEHIKEAIDMFLSNDCDSVVSVASVNGNHPFRMKKLINNQLINFIDQGFWDMRPRQELPEVYIRNGAIYLINKDQLLKQKQLIGNKCLGYIMNDKDSINIDSEIDLILADLLIKERQSK